MAKHNKSGGKSRGKAGVESPTYGNPKARHKFELLDRLECGIVLLGSEVKSLRAGNASLEEGFARIRGNELWLLRMHIEEYGMRGSKRHDPIRPRKLLLHKREIDKLRRIVEREGRTLIPTRLFFNERGLVKVEIALARGKKLHDKRADDRKKSMEREMQSARRS